jgi:hypothetical protein
VKPPRLTPPHRAASTAPPRVTARVREGLLLLIDLDIRARELDRMEAQEREAAKPKQVAEEQP